jgi:Glycosyltransferase family 87
MSVPASRSSLDPVAGPVWFATPRFSRVVMVLLLAVIIAEGVVAVFLRVNDVANHYYQGRKLLFPDPTATAEYYRYVPYPAGRATLNALLAWLPYRVFRATLYLLSIASLIGSFTLWDRMAASRRPIRPEVRFVAGVTTVMLLSPWIVRDLDDCGTQILLLFMLSVSAFLWERGRDWSAGVWLGIAIAYKATPLLLIPFLVLTGRWRTAAVSLTVAAALCLSPALFIGWDRAMNLNVEFAAVTLANSRIEDPSENGFEPPRHKNQGLVLALARLLRTYPPGHPLYIQHPLFVQFLDLPPATAGLIAKAIVFTGLALLGWRIGRKAWREGRAADLVPEWAALCLLCALLSPICWGPHLTLCIPAAFLVLRDVYDRLARGKWPRGRDMIGLVVISVLVLGLPRELIGQDRSILVLSFKVYTLAAVILLTLILTRPPHTAD